MQSDPVRQDGNATKSPLNDGFKTPRLEFDDLPKSRLTGKPVLHFAHANGIPSRVYRVLFEQLHAEFTIVYIPILGFNEQGGRSHPIDNHWQQIVKQVIDSVADAKHQHGVPICGLGHSFGALCTLLATYKRPELFFSAVLLDPPLLVGRTSAIWHLSKLMSPKILERWNLSLSDKLSPAGLSKHRQDVWESKQAARQSLQSKSLFKNFVPAAFDDYLKHGLTEQEDGSVRLAISKLDEVTIFRRLPSMFWLKPRRPPKVPVTLVVGEDSIFLKKRFPQQIQRQMAIDFVTHRGGHMFPLEYPSSVAQTITDVLLRQLR